MILIASPAPFVTGCQCFNCSRKSEVADVTGKLRDEIVRYEIALSKLRDQNESLRQSLEEKPSAVSRVAGLLACAACFAWGAAWHVWMTR